MHASHSGIPARFLFFGLALIWLNAGCISSRRVEDYTFARSAICEVHDVPMKEKIVPQTYGMRRSGWILNLRCARQRLFPHAGEVYDTYACLASYERYARIHVCLECTTARQKWLVENPPAFEYDWQYLDYCDSLWRQFAQSYVRRN